MEKLKTANDSKFLVPVDKIIRSVQLDLTQVNTLSTTKYKPHVRC